MSQYTAARLSAFVALTALLLPGIACGELQLVDGIAAVVGDQIVLESEVDEELYIYRMRTGSSISSDEEGLLLRRRIVDEMVNEMLLVAKAHRDSVRLRPGQLEEEIENRIAELRERRGSSDALDAALAAQGLTIEQLEELYRDDIERRLLAETVVRADVHAKIDVTWGEVEQYFEEHSEEVGRRPERFDLAGILVIPEVSEQAQADAFARLEAARGELADGASFEDVARRYSEDGTASSGGDLGTFGRGMMVPEFEEAAFALSEGELSGIVTTRFGFHLIQALERDGDRLHARHILVKVATGPEDEERAIAEAESLRQAAMTGVDFAALATEHSDDPDTRSRGGALGWFTAEDLAPAFRGVVAEMMEGEVSDVVKGEAGYYVLKLVGHEEERVAELDEIREDLRDYIFGLKAEEAYNDLLERLRSEIFVDIRTGTASTE